MQLTKVEVQQIVKTKMETQLGKKINDFNNDEWKSYQIYWSGFFDGLKYAGVKILE